MTQFEKLTITIAIACGVLPTIPQNSLPNDSTPNNNNNDNNGKTSGILFAVTCLEWELHTPSTNSKSSVTSYSDSEHTNIYDDNNNEDNENDSDDSDNDKQW